MISPSTLRAAVNLAVPAADLALDAAPAAALSVASAARSVLARPPAVPGRSLAPLAVARRSARPAKRSRTGRSSAAGYAPAAKASAKTTTAAKTSTKAPASDPLAFLKDPRLSIEEKLMKLLGYMNGKWEKEMQKKLDQIGASEGEKKAASTSSGSKKKSGGLLGSVGDFVKAAFPPAGLAVEALKIPMVRDLLGKVSGPVLAAGATALGFPQLAPVLLKYGPDLVKTASGFVSSLDGDGEGGGGSKGSGTSSSAGSKSLSDAEKQTLLMEIQRIQQKQQEMFSLVSNVLKSNHDTRSAVIGNIR